MKRQLIGRREFLRASAAVAALGMLSACAPAAKPATATPEAKAEATTAAATPAAAPASVEGVKIDMWVLWEQYKNAVDAYLPTLLETIAPNTIEIRTGMTREEVFLPAVAAGTPPDMGTIANNAYSRQFMKNGLLLAIDDMMASSQVVSVDKFSEGSFRDKMYESHYYGFPAFEGFVPWGLNYNAKLVTEAGLDPDAPPSTWSECMTWHKALTTFDDAGNLLQIGLDPQDAVGYGVELYGASYGFVPFDPETGTFDLNNELMAQAFEEVGEFAKVIGPDNLAGFRQTEGNSEWGGSYNMERQAMILEGYWHPGETFTEVPEVAKHNRATWIPVSDARKGTKISITSCHMVQFFKEGNVDLDVMWPVGEFLVSDLHLNTCFNKVGWLCPYTSFLAKADRTKFPGLEFYFRSVEEADVMFKSGLALCDIATFVNNEFKAFRQKVYRDELTGAEAAAQYQQSVEQEWEDTQL